MTLALGIDFTQTLITIAALVIAWSIIIMVYNLVSSARTQQVAVTNPWRSRSPEWQVPSPMPEMNYDEPFEVVGDPYDYGLSGSYVNMHPGTAVVAAGD